MILSPNAMIDTATGGRPAPQAQTAGAGAPCKTGRGAFAAILSGKPPAPVSAEIDAHLEQSAPMQEEATSDMARGEDGTVSTAGPIDPDSMAEDGGPTLAPLPADGPDQVQGMRAGHATETQVETPADVPTDDAPLLPRPESVRAAQDRLAAGFSAAPPPARSMPAKGLPPSGATPPAVAPPVTVAADGQQAKAADTKPHGGGMVTAHLSDPAPDRANPDPIPRTPRDAPPRDAPGSGNIAAAMTHGSAALAVGSSSARGAAAHSDAMPPQAAITTPAAQAIVPGQAAPARYAPRQAPAPDTAWLNAAQQTGPVRAAPTPLAPAPARTEAGLHSPASADATPRARADGPIHGMTATRSPSLQSPVMAQPTGGLPPPAPTGQPITGNPHPVSEEASSLSRITFQAELSPLADHRSAPVSAEGARMAHSPAQGDLPRHVAAQLADAAKPGLGPDRPVELTLNPAELGRVRISMAPGDGTIIVTVLAERGETLDLMRRHADMLAQEFHELGYDAAEFEFGQRNTGADPETDERSPALATAIEAASQPAPHPLSSVSLSSDRVDIRL